MERMKRILSGAIVFGVLVFTQIAFGGYAVVSKVALKEGVDPVFFSFLRDVIAAPLLLLAAWFLEGLPRPKLEDLYLFILLGFTGIYGNQLFFIMGVDYTSSVNASLMQPSIPVFTTLLAAIFKIEPLQPFTYHGALKILGIVLSVAGAVIVIVLSSNTSEAENVILGNICLIINCASFAVYAILQKFVLRTYPPVSVSAWSYCFGVVCIGMSLLGCTASEGEGSSRWSLPTSSLYALAYGAFLCSALCYGLLSWCNSKTSPTIVTAFWPLQVVASAFLSAIFLDYKIVSSDVIGAVLVVGGLFCVILAKKVQEMRAKPTDSSVESLIPPDGSESPKPINEGSYGSIATASQNNEKTD